MVSFDSNLSQRVIFGDNSIEKLAQATITLGGSRVLIISDSGIKEAGILKRAYSSLNNEKIHFHVFTDVETEPNNKTCI